MNEVYNGRFSPEFRVSMLKEMIVQAFSGEACDRTRTRPHTRKSV